ncbi:hypothetical protein V1478_011780 [Vespula squamosa]|uniref:Uncharacterized protein n=1 Tax=Vespula squamosa TaxID=30214 RepID=A0ABD2ABB2_VESSQ
MEPYQRPPPTPLKERPGRVLDTSTNVISVFSDAHSQRCTSYPEDVRRKIWNFYDSSSSTRQEKKSKDKVRHSVQTLILPTTSSEALAGCSNAVRGLYGVHRGFDPPTASRPSGTRIIC